MRINEIQEQVGRGEYRVDNHAVADAILRRMLSVHEQLGLVRRDDPSA